MGHRGLGKPQPASHRAALRARDIFRPLCLARIWLLGPRGSFKSFSLYPQVKWFPVQGVKERRDRRVERAKGVDVGS